MKQKNKKIALGIFLVFTLVFSTFGVFAQNKFIQSNKFSKEKMEEINNKFQNKFNYNCTGECVYSEFGNNLRLKINQGLIISEKLNLTLNFRDEYILDDEGNIIQTKNNLWSKLFNKNRISFS